MTKRENKYRGKRIDNGEWVHGNLIKMDAQGSQSFIFPFRNFASTLSCGQIVAYNMVEVDPDTVGQFTGLKDKSGVEIWEGDVLSFKEILWSDCSRAKIIEVREEALIGIITYNELCSVVKVYRGNVSSFGWNHETNECIMIDINPEELKVIGNIHENPELMEP